MQQQYARRGATTTGSLQRAGRHQRNAGPMHIVGRGIPVLKLAHIRNAPVDLAAQATASASPRQRDQDSVKVPGLLCRARSVRYQPARLCSRGRRRERGVPRRNPSPPGPSDPDDYWVGRRLARTPEQARSRCLENSALRPRTKERPPALDRSPVDILVLQPEGQRVLLREPRITQSRHTINNFVT
jgi:hypothetical protein